MRVALRTLLWLPLLLAAPLSAQEEGATAPAGEAQPAATATQSGAFTEIGGPLPKTVRADRGPYLVVADIEVLANRMTTIEPGTVFLFRNFTALHVQGRLVAEGTKAESIVFTSEFDKVYNPSSPLDANPFDWDGVYLHDDALGSVLSYCKVAYSVYGIISDTKFIRIDPAMLRFNGKSNLVIEGEEHEVAENPYRYVLSTKDATVDGVSVKILEDPLAVKRNAFRYTGLVAVVGGCAAGIYSALELVASQDRLNDMSGTDFENLNANSGQAWEIARRSRNLDIFYASASGAAAVLGTVGFIWTFTF